MTSPATETETASAPTSGRRLLFTLLCAGALALGGTAACGTDDGGGAADDGSSVDAGGDGGGGGDGDGTGGGDGDGGGGGDGGGDGGEVDCPLGEPRDPAGLPECCAENGPAHCLPAADLDPEAIDQLAACEDGQSYCAPDTWIEGDVELLPCTSVLGEEGVCLSLCIPVVAENADQLPQDVCAANEKCAPCINPLDGMPTGACELDLTCEADGGDGGGGDDDGGDDDGGDDDGGDGGGAESCCDSRGLCIPAELAGDQAENLEQDTCTDEEQLCAPVELIDDSFVAEPCDSTIGGLGGNPEGACMFDCLANTGLFLQDGCADGFKCVACEVPILGETGACDFLPGGGD